MEIPFRVENPSGVEHSSWPVRGGIPFPRHAASADASFAVVDAEGNAVPAQVDVTATWPDGSLKWALVHLRAALRADGGAPYRLLVGEGAPSGTETALRVDEADEVLRVENGVFSFRVPTEPGPAIDGLTLREAAGEALLAGGEGCGFFLDIAPHGGGPPQRFESARTPSSRAAVEAAGPEEVTLRLTGDHVDEAGHALLPYTCRLHVYPECGLIRFSHFVVFDLDPQVHAVRAIGFRLPLALAGLARFDFGGEGRDVVETVVQPDPLGARWSSGALRQDGSSRFLARKWVDRGSNAPVRLREGGRSSGWAGVEDGARRLTLGIRNFWQEYPKAIEIDADTGELIAWLYSPYGDPLDLRRYSDRIYRAKYEAPCVRDGSPVPFDHENDGARYIGKTMEFFLNVAPVEDPTPPWAVAALCQTPPILTPGVEWIAETRVFGEYATLPRSSCAQASDHVREIVGFWLAEPERRGWYSFMDHGDVMHSFDPSRDEWRFDEGGYAWNNNEGLSCEALWTAYLATGDLRVFRMAEAMTRHINDVDMYHLGPRAGYGTRHNVSHWGDRGKERRMTIPANKRVYYFLTGDEHTRDLARFAYETLAQAKRRCNEAMDVGVGATALLFLWETTGEARYGELLRRITELYCSKRHKGRGFYKALRMDFETGEGEVVEDGGLQQDFFLLDFGPMDILLDSVELTRSEAVRKAILRWAEILLMPVPERAQYQASFMVGRIGEVHAMRVAAYAYRQTGDPRFREVVERGLTTACIRFETVRGRALDRPHPAPRLTYEPREMWDTYREWGASFAHERDPLYAAGELGHALRMSIALRNIPYGLAGPAVPDGQECVLCPESREDER